MREGDDPRNAALLTLVLQPAQRELVDWLLQSLAVLEQTDFGELEPVGIGAPAVRE